MKRIILFIVLILITITMCSNDIARTTKVSWYGPGFEGRVTASGEIYSQDSLTCASPIYKFGTLVKITNLENNKSIIVKVNDRGPYQLYIDSTSKVRPYYPLKPHKSRGFDLSKAAFDSIGDLNKGILKVKYSILVRKPFTCRNWKK